MKCLNRSGSLLRPCLTGVALLAVALFGCTPSSVKCSRGLTRCGTGCADFAVDKYNCGACGVSCQLNQICQNGQCQCQPGAILCEGACSLIASDPGHCGGCTDAGGRICAANEVCQEGRCQARCTLSFTACDAGSCLDLQTDMNNCGSCGSPCAQGRRCRGGNCTYDVVAACADAGQIFGLQSPADIRGQGAPVGTSPRALGVSGGVLLFADDRDQLLYQVKLSDFSSLGGSKRVGQGPRQVLVSGAFVYVVNEQSNTLQIFQQDAGDQLDAGAGLPDGGLPWGFGGGMDGGSLNLGLRSQFSFDAGSAPQTVAALGPSLFITLYGGAVSDGGSAAGQRVARVDSPNPSQPFLVDSFPLDAGSSSLARPTGVVVHAGSIYAAMANLTATDIPSGPGKLAKIDPPSGSVQILGLGDGCLNPQWIAEVGDSLAVSCAGNSPSVASALVLVDRNDQVVSIWRGSCPGIGCVAPVLSRFAVVGNRIYAGDLIDGRLFVIEVVGNQLVERRGFSPDAGAIQVCPGTAITDVISIP